MARLLPSLCLFLLLGIGAFSLRAPPKEFRKQLAGPPSEFKHFTLPKPLGSASPADTSVTSIVPQKHLAENSGWVWTESFPVDSSSQVSVSVASPHAHQLVLDVAIPSPSGELVSIQADKIIDDSFGLAVTANNMIPLRTFVFDKPIIGTWKATITSSTPSQISDDVPSDGFFIVYNKSPLNLFAKLNTDSLEQGRDIGLQAQVHDHTSAVPAPLVGLDAEMYVLFPNGAEHTFSMQDDGMSNDLEENDGVYGAEFEASQVGTYTAQTRLTGKTPQGHSFIRTTEHTFTIIEPAITLTGLATSRYDAKERVVKFDIDVDSPSTSSYAMDVENGFTVKAYAEVWGTDKSGLEYVPVAWMEAMVDPVPSPLDEDSATITLQLDEAWLSKAHASAPFQLRNVWIQERDTNTAFSTREEVFVASDRSLASLRVDFDVDPDSIPITDAMKNGPRPAFLLNSTSDDASSPNEIVLVHGYCAGQNEWPLNEFTNAVHFEDFDQSRSNDAFALRLLDFIQGKKNVRLVGHSQGGLASTHLITFYWSPADAVGNGGRLIQSKGSPYQGSGLSAWGSLGKLVGIGCGVNNDMTYDGAAQWVASIPQDKAAQVHAYISKYGSDGYCVWGANIFLYKPNDGTTEVEKSLLPGSTRENAREDFCHTTGMVYPNQCSNSATNAEINKYASA